MIEHIDSSLIDWSRAQFALTAIYHWIFVPLTLGLAVVMGLMETFYYRTGDPFWKRTARFWMKLFGINFAIGVATGLILEFEFGTNWSNYSWFVGDIFGAPLAIEGIVAFFMEATFIAVMFFGWQKVNRGFHLASTWLTGLGATISAWWILVANAWMQYPVGMEFNPDTARNEMVDFWAVATSPMAVNKFFHTVLSSWVLGALFVVGVGCWYLWKKCEHRFALSSIKEGASVGLFAALMAAWTGDESGYQVAQHQPMKLAAMEGYYEGQEGAGLVAFGYELKDGTTALSAMEKMAYGRKAIEAFAAYREAHAEGDEAAAEVAARELKDYMPYFGYGYIKDAHELVPNVPLTFYMFRVMVMMGGYFIVFFLVVLFVAFRKDLSRLRWLQMVAMLSVPLGYLAGQAGWVVAECGRQPWTIQDMLPVGAAISKLEVGSVQTTFFLFLFLFTILLVAEVGIMLKAIRKGPENSNVDIHSSNY